MLIGQISFETLFQKKLEFRKLYLENFIHHTILRLLPQIIIFFISQILLTLKGNFKDIELKFLDIKKLFSAPLLHISTIFSYRLATYGNLYWPIHITIQIRHFPYRQMADTDISADTHTVPQCFEILGYE